MSRTTSWSTGLQEEHEIQRQEEHHLSSEKRKTPPEVKLFVPKKSEQFVSKKIVICCASIVLHPWIPVNLRTLGGDLKECQKLTCHMKLWNQNTVPHHFKLRRAPSLLRRWRAWEKPQTSTRELDICILRKKWCWEWVRYQLVSEGLLLLLLFVLQESRCSRGEWSHSDKAMTCYTTQNAAWSMSQSILSIVLFFLMFWKWRDNKQMQFFRRFFPAPRKGKQILRWHIRMHGDSGSGRHATCLNSARQTWHAPISKCQATTVSWGPQFTKLALSFHPASFKKYQHQVLQLKIKQVQLWIPWIPANQNRSPWIVVWEFLSYTTLLAHASFRRLINEIHGWWTKSWLMTQFHSLTFGH